LKKGQESDERNILLHVLHNKMYLEEYDMIVSQCGNHFGEGWNGCYRIYNDEGNYVSLDFRCNCYPSSNREDIKMTAKIINNSLFQTFNLIETRENEDPLFKVDSLLELRKFLQLEHVTLTLLFCFFVYSMGQTFFIFNFQALSSESFSNFWEQLEAIDKNTSPTVNIPDDQ